MHLNIHHRTRYVYRVPVVDSYNEVRLRPATDDPKRLSSFLLTVFPPRQDEAFSRREPQLCSVV